MIHKIKAMYDSGRGSSLRAIAQEPGISRNTVRKYATMPEEDIAACLDERERCPSAWTDTATTSSICWRPTRA